MIVVEEKKKTNIAEYVILMYQTEDMLRAYHFDIERIKTDVITPQIPSESLRPTVTNWYLNLIEEMKKRGLEQAGHVHEVQEVIAEIIYLHNTLLSIVKDEKYKNLLNQAVDNIEAFREKSDLKEMHPVEVCFHAMYMKLLMRLQKKEISAETEHAFDSMRMLLAYLSRAYHDMKAGKMDMFQ